MGWEVLHDTEKEYFALMCNTADVAFGNLIATHGNRPNDFYGWWSLKNLGDPRSLSERDVEQAISDWNGINIPIIGELEIPIAFPNTVSDKDGETIVQTVKMRFEGDCDMAGDDGYNVGFLLPNEYKTSDMKSTTYYDIPFNNEELAEAFYDFVDHGDFRERLKNTLGNRDVDYEGNGDFNGTIDSGIEDTPVLWKITRIKNGPNDTRSYSYDYTFRDVEDKEYE